MKSKTAKAIKNNIAYEDGCIAFWQRLLAAVESADGTAVQIINERIARAHLRRDGLRAALESGEEVTVTAVFKRIRPY